MSLTKNSHRSVWPNLSWGFLMPSVLDLGKESGCFTEFHFLELRGVAHTTSLGLSCDSLTRYATMVEDREHAPPAWFTLWPLCTGQLALTPFWLRKGFRWLDLSCVAFSQSRSSCTGSPCLRTLNFGLSNHRNMWMVQDFSQQPSGDNLESLLRQVH